MGEKATKEKKGKTKDGQLPNSAPKKPVNAESAAAKFLRETFENLMAESTWLTQRWPVISLIVLLAAGDGNRAKSEATQLRALDRLLELMEKAEHGKGKPFEPTKETSGKPTTS